MGKGTQDIIIIIIIIIINFIIIIIVGLFVCIVASLLYMVDSLIVRSMEKGFCVVIQATLSVVIAYYPPAGAVAGSTIEGEPALWRFSPPLCALYVNAIYPDYRMTR